MKFINICKQVLEDKKLQRVRIKADPAWLSTLALDYTPSFEGYILQEMCGMGGIPDFKVFIINTPPGYNPVQTVSSNNLEKIEDTKDDKISSTSYSKMTLLKKAILNKAIEMGKKEDDPDVLQIMNSKDIGFIETFLRQMGLDEEDLLNLYRKCFNRV